MIINNNCTTQTQKPAFTAAFKTDMPVKNLKRLANIQDLFAKKTQHYANDTLTLTKSMDPSFDEMPVVTTTINEMQYEDYKYAHLFEPLDNMMERVTDNQIVKTLINYFKMLKKREAFDVCVNNANKTIEHLEFTKAKNESVAENCFEAGKTVMGNRYKVLAQNAQKKLESVKLQQENDKAKIVKEMQKIADNEPSLNFVPEIYSSPDFS